MPLNCVPGTTSVEALEAKREAARGHCHIDWAAWGGVVRGNQQNIEPLAAGGVRGHKCFLIDPAIDSFTIEALVTPNPAGRDPKSTPLNSSHQIISYSLFSLKKKNITTHHHTLSHICN